MDDAPKEILENACRYLRKEYGRPETEFARRIPWNLPEGVLGSLLAMVLT